MDGMIAEIDTDGSGTVDFDGEHTDYSHDADYDVVEKLIEGDCVCVLSDKKKFFPFLYRRLDWRSSSPASFKNIFQKDTTTITTCCFPEERFLFARNEKSYLEIIFEISLTSLSFEYTYIFACMEEYIESKIDVDACEDSYYLHFSFFLFFF